MPCTVKKTLNAIVNSGNDYLVALKKNQPTLYHIVEQLATTTPAYDCYQRSEHNHGRSERRIVSVWDASSIGQIVDPEWPAVRWIIRVERYRRIDKHGHSSRTTVYYLTSRSEGNAYQLGQLIRGHWQIENRLHWVKDVQQNEDRCGIRGGESAENLSVLKTLALTLYRLQGYDSLKTAVISFANNIKELCRLLRT